jgi:hypothetical protein
MHVNKAFVLNINDANLLKENAKKLGLTESSFVKLCILIGSKELGLHGDYSFKYSYLKWYKPDDLIKEIKEFIENNEEKAVVQKEDKVVAQKKDQDASESKVEKKEQSETIKKPKIQL